MKLCELCPTGSSGASKGFRQDQRTNVAIKRREQARRNHQDADAFAKLVLSMCPGYFGEV